MFIEKENDVDLANGGSYSYETRQIVLCGRKSDLLELTGQALSQLR